MFIDTAIFMLLLIIAFESVSCLGYDLLQLNQPYSKCFSQMQLRYAHGLHQGRANYGLRDHFMRPAGTFRNINLLILSGI